MNSEERFKKNLEELLTSKEFSFDEANWEKAREIIDTSKKQNRRALPLILASLILLLSLLTGFYFFPGTSSVNAGKLASNSTSGIAASTPSTEEKAAPTSSAKELSKSSTSPQRTNLAPLPGKEIAESPEKVTATSPHIPETKNPVENVSIKPGNSSNIKIKNTASSNPVIPGSSVNKDPELPVAAKQDQIAKQNDNMEPSAPSINKTGEQIAVKEKESPEQIASDINSPSRKEKEDAASINPIVPETPSNKENPGDNKSDSVPATLPDTLNNNNSQITNVLPPDNDQGQLGKPKEFPILFSIEAGTSYLMGWKNPGSRDANGFNPTIGVNYFNNFNPKMSLSVGLHYSSVNNLSFSTYSSKVVRLGFGEESRVTVFTPVKVHYLIVPLRFNYELDPKNTLGVGCNLAYLLNIEGDVESYTEKLNVISDRSTSKTTGYGKGFKKYDTQISAFYKRRFYPCLALNLEVFYGLTDIKENRFFNSSAFERNTGLKLTLVYNFIKK